MAKDQFLYTKIYSDLKEKIENGQIPVRGKLPSDEELKQEYQVSVITIKRAMQMLTDEKLVRRIPGKGTFVIEKEQQMVQEHVEYTEMKSPLRKEGNLIGVILEHAMPSFGIDLMYELDNAAEKMGYRMILRFSHGNREREIEEIEFLMSLGVKGLIILPCHGFYYNVALLKLVIEGVPVVVLDKKMEGIQVPSIRTDNTDAVFRLVDYLKTQGKNRIGMLTVDAESAISLVERKRAFRKRIEQLHLSVMEECVLPQVSYEMLKHVPFEDYVIRIEDYLKRYGKQLDGAVCMDYGILMAYVEAARRAGDAASHILVCSIDAVYVVPGGPKYVHIKQNEVAIADKAMELLQEQIEGKRITEEEIKIPGIFQE